jgi:hypothetical protein
MVARLGEHIEVFVNARWKVRPFCSSACWFGVRSRSQPE